LKVKVINKEYPIELIIPVLSNEFSLEEIVDITRELEKYNPKEVIQELVKRTLWDLTNF